MGIHWFSGDASLQPRLPMAWAAALMIILILPLGLYLGAWNIPLWICFIVWTEYFILGAHGSTWKVIVPCIAFGSAAAAAWIAAATALTGVLEAYLEPTHSIYAAYALTNLVFVPLVFNLCQSVRVFETGTLAVFNGFSLMFAVFFTRSIPSVNAIESPYAVIFYGCLWTIAAAYVGWGFGWLNVLLTFPHPAAEVSEG